MSIFINIFTIVMLLVLGMSLVKTGPNSFVNREMALHAKALDEIYLASTPGMSFDILMALRVSY